jgi:hypothetical protein
MADATANIVLQEQLLELEALGAVFGDDLHLSRIEGDNHRFAEAVVAAAGDASAAAAAADVPALPGTMRLPDCELAGAPVHLAFVLPKQGAPGLQVQTNAPRQVCRCWVVKRGGRCYAAQTMQEHSGFNELWGSQRQLYTHCLLSAEARQIGYSRWPAAPRQSVMGSPACCWWLTG